MSNLRKEVNEIITQKKGLTSDADPLEGLVSRSYQEITTAIKYAATKNFEKDADGVYRANLLVPYHKQDSLFICSTVSYKGRGLLLKGRKGLYELRPTPMVWEFISRLSKALCSDEVNLGAPLFSLFDPDALGGEPSKISVIGSLTLVLCDHYTNFNLRIASPALSAPANYVAALDEYDYVQEWTMRAPKGQVPKIEGLLPTLEGVLLPCMLIPVTYRI